MHLARTGAPGERQAIQLMTDAVEYQNSFGKDRDASAIRANTRRILATMTETERKAVDEAMKKLNDGKGLADFYTNGLGKDIGQYDK